jgi:hypothetical protein
MDLQIFLHYFSFLYYLLPNLIELILLISDGSTFLWIILVAIPGLYNDPKEPSQFLLFAPILVGWHNERSI